MPGLDDADVQAAPPADLADVWPPAQATAVQAPPQEVPPGIALSPQAPVVSAPAPSIAPGTPLGTSGQPLPDTFQRSYTLSHTPQPQPDQFGGMGDIPTEQSQQASQAIAAAMKYQAMRGYQQDLNQGVPAEKAIAKWAPMLFGQSAATKPNYNFVAGENGAPATYQAPGQRPVIVPRGALPPPPGGDALLKEEIIPGVWAVREPGKGLHIVKEGGGALTEAQRASLSARIPGMMASLQRFDPGSPEYAASTNAVQAVRQAAEGAPKRAQVRAPTTTGSTSANPYKVGKRYGNMRYKGGDPKDESSWEKVQ